jgi:hypothetical protein
MAVTAVAAGAVDGATVDGDAPSRRPPPDLPGRLGQPRRARPPRRPPVEAHAYFRAGWRGDGQVPWPSEGNRGFLRSLAGLARAATAIAEQDEADRCRKFLKDLAPDAPQPT